MQTLRTANGKKATGFVFYQGPSMLDGRPIVGIATGLKESTNRKTGNMVQLYFLRSDIAPLEAVKTKGDESICGDCKHRGSSCYVRVEQGPTVVYKAYLRGNYPSVTLDQAIELLAGHAVRIGAYGDAAALPMPVLETILDKVTEYTGYTHQWKKAEAWNPAERTTLQKLTMASCDNAEEYRLARAQGWRAFVVVSKGTAKVEGAFLCPASEEAGKKLTCSDCLACSGNGGKGTASVFIPVHGAKHKQAQFITIGRN